MTPFRTGSVPSSGNISGVPENIAYRLREGDHAHLPSDFDALIAFIEDMHAVTDGYDVTPF